MHLLLTFVGIVVVAFQTYELWRGWRARMWPTAPGEIVDIGVEWSGAMARSAHSTIRYRYMVDGTPLEGTRLKFGAQAGRPSEQSARAMVQHLAPGVPVAVHYNPLTPSEAVLHPGWSVDDLFVLLVGVALCAGSLVL